MIRWCKTHELQALPTADKIEVCAGVWREGDCSIVDAVVLSRQPCNNCEGSGYGGNAGHIYNSESEMAGNTEHICRQCPVPCPSCLGSGTTWPDWLLVLGTADFWDCVEQAQLEEQA